MIKYQILFFSPEYLSECILHGVPVNFMKNIEECERVESIGDIQYVNDSNKYVVYVKFKVKKQYESAERAKMSKCIQLRKTTQGASWTNEIEGASCKRVVVEDRGASKS